jgi:signal transduction histidine kinase
VDEQRRPLRMLGITLDISERRQAEEQLTTSLHQLHALSAHLQTIRENERTTIAREIHDELGQSLTGMKMDLYWLKNRIEKQAGVELPNPITNKLSNLLLEADLVIDVVRRISTALRPSILDTLGLLPALEWLTGDFQARSGITCAFQTPLTTLDLPQDFSTAVFRICQEALTNVVRHAQASEVVVQFGFRAKNLVLTIEDDGKGISEEDINRPDSLGVLGMKERALVYDGSVEFTSAATGGTCVTAWFPIVPTIANQLSVEDV